MRINVRNLRVKASYEIQSMSQPHHGRNDQTEGDTEGEELSLIRHVSSLLQRCRTFIELRGGDYSHMTCRHKIGIIGSSAVKDHLINL